MSKKRVKIDIPPKPFGVKQEDWDKLQERIARKKMLGPNPRTKDIRLLSEDDPDDKYIIEGNKKIRRYVNSLPNYFGGGKVRKNADKK